MSSEFEFEQKLEKYAEVMLKVGLNNQPEESLLKRLDLIRNTALSSPCVGDRGLVVKSEKLKIKNF